VQSVVGGFGWVLDRSTACSDAQSGPIRMEVQRRCRSGWVSCFAIRFARLCIVIWKYGGRPVIAMLGPRALADLAIACAREAELLVRT
jgi:hypothetical protein